MFNECIDVLMGELVIKGKNCFHKSLTSMIDEYIDVVVVYHTSLTH